MKDNYYLKRSSQKLHIAGTALFSFAISNKPTTDFSKAVSAGVDEITRYLFLLQIVLFLIALGFSLLGCANAIQSFRAQEPYAWTKGKLLIGNYIVLLVCLLVLLSNVLQFWRP